MNSNLRSVPKQPTGAFPPLLRLLDVYFSAVEPSPQKQRCLNTILVCCQNVFMNPEEPKYRSIKSRNARFNKDVLQCAGGDLVLLEIGFTRQIKEFEEYFVLDPAIDIATDYWRLKKYKDLMDTALMNDKNAPANRIKAEREAKEAAIRQIEEDNKNRKYRQQRSLLSKHKLPTSSESDIPSNSKAKYMAEAAATRRRTALEAPIVIATDMLPTPSLTHLKEEDYDNVYEPAEDSFALLDALQNDISLLRTSAHIPLVLEIGSGTGIVSTFIQQSIYPSSLHLCTDLNNFACKTTLATSQANVRASTTSLDIIRTALVDGLRIRNIDLIVFNPPYVPTSFAEINTQGGIAAAWAGGEDGMDVTVKILSQVADLLSENGLFYLVAVARNKPDQILQYVQTVGLQGRIVLERRAGREKLVILRFHRLMLGNSTDRERPPSEDGHQIPETQYPQTEARRLDGQSADFEEDALAVGVLD